MVKPDCPNFVELRFGENVLTIPMDLLRQPIGVIDELTLLRVALARSIQSPLPYAGTAMRSTV